MTDDRLNNLVSLGDGRFIAREGAVRLSDMAELAGGNGDLSKLHPDEIMQLLCSSPASADTHPKDGDSEAAPLVSGAVPKGDAQ